MTIITGYEHLNNHELMLAIQKAGDRLDKMKQGRGTKMHLTMHREINVMRNELTKRGFDRNNFSWYPPGLRIEYDDWGSFKNSKYGIVVSRYGENSIIIRLDGEAFPIKVDKSRCILIKHITY